MMNGRLRCSLGAVFTFVVQILALSNCFGATTNRWANSVGALWTDAANWSAGVPPSTAFTYVMITNAGTKTVSINASTPAANLSVSNLIISAPSGSTNTLLIANAASPFTTLRPVSVNARGVLQVTNTTFTAYDTFDIGGALILDSGSIDTTPSFVDARIGRINGTTGVAKLNGGTFTCMRFLIGANSSAPGQCTINGATVSPQDFVGLGEASSASGTLTLNSGQLLATNGCRVGDLAAGTFVQNGGSATYSFLAVGYNSPGTYTITNGQLTVVPQSATDWMQIANSDTGQLTISGGTVRSLAEFHVSDTLTHTGIVVVAGGQLICTNDLTAIGRYGPGFMTISNGTVTATNVSIGRHDGAVGTLTLQTNGSFFAVDDVSIGRFTNAVGHVYVSGGLLSLPNDTLWVGRDGIGDLIVSNGTVRAQNMYVGKSEDGTNTPKGTVTIRGGSTWVSSSLIVGTSLLSTGQVSVLGGELNVTNPAGSAVLTVSNGTFTIDQGTVSADQLILASTNGNFSFPRGTLQVRNITVSNGSPFVVGDGINSATLRLQGGTYSFANGLVISPNATVTVCGSINGTITNNGTLTTNCSSTLVINSIAKSGNTATLSFSTLNGTNYVLEYKNTLADSVWTAITPSIIGLGGITNMQDTNAITPTRFYRLHIP